MTELISITQVTTEDAAITVMCNAAMRICGDENSCCVNESDTGAHFLFQVAVFLPLPLNT